MITYIDDSTWWNEYKPKYNDLDYLWHTDELFKNQLAKPDGIKYIWSAVDTDEEIVLMNGMHVVNRLGYVICENPWKQGEDITVVHDEEDYHG